MSHPHQATCVAIQQHGQWRGILIEGPPGSGKSSLALALMDRGATLVGDDGVLIEAREGGLYAQPHPNIRGKLEVRNLGLFDFPVCDEVRLALIVRLDPQAPRFIDQAEQATLYGRLLPMVRLWPDTPVLALRAELALQRYGLVF